MGQVLYGIATAIEAVRLAIKIWVRSHKRDSHQVGDVIHLPQRGGDWMADFFWYSDEQWARTEPLLPRDPRGMPRADDRRGLFGIVYALRSGGSWGDCPEPVDDPKNTLYNRFRHWAARGV